MFRYEYEVIFGMALKELPEDFSFKVGKYREIIDEKIDMVNECGKTVANPKELTIVEEKTTAVSLVLRLKSEQKLDIPTRACKALSRELAKTEVFKDLLANGGPNGKLFVGKSSKELPREERVIDEPELMKIITKIILRKNGDDINTLEQIVEILKNNGYTEVE